MMANTEGVMPPAVKWVLFAAMAAAIEAPVGEGPPMSPMEGMEAPMEALWTPL